MSKYLKNLNFIKLWGIIVIVSLMLSFASLTYAHVTLLQPVGGEVLEGNSNFTIKWDIDEEVAPDENWDIRFSRDNGRNFNVVVRNLGSTVRQFDWRVPNINTTQGLIEVIEDFPEGPDDGASSGPFTIVKNTAFQFSCEDSFRPGPGGLEKLILTLGDEQSCILKLTHFEPGMPVEISTNLRTGRLASIEVSPIRDITNDNGEIEFTIIAINEGIDWVSWAAPNSEGKFEFTKKAYDEGRAWGIFVEVR